MKRLPKDPVKRARGIRAERLRRDRRNVGLDTIKQCLGLYSHCSNESLAYLFSILRSGRYDDVVFVALDAKAYEHSVREIGISTLDTRDLTSLAPGSDLSAVISSNNYITQQSKGKSGQRQFKFGTSKRVDLRWVPWLLNKVPRTGSPDPLITEKRNVILIGHAIGTDLSELDKVPFQLDPEIDVLILETSLLCCEAFNGATLLAPKLVEVVDLLGVSHEHVKLHNAGNDANLTLKVLLKLAVESCASAEMTSQQWERRDLLAAVVEANKVGWPTEIDGMNPDLFKDAEIEAQKREQAVSGA
ncbi:hypothetical protein EG329_002207 [Mollisiaceae sp. DMI_Dod_QoI]|nr:hypothetical protein EG329_002207 [Helotiales sp. DMI_Dod_QoI]